MKLGLETESYHLFFQQGMMDIFDFIDKTSELGLDGVELISFRMLVCIRNLVS